MTRRVVTISATVLTETASRIASVMPVNGLAPSRSRSVYTPLAEPTYMKHMRSVEA